MTSRRHTRANRVARRGGIRLISIVAALVMLVTGTVAGSAMAADDYPTYSDLQEARADVAKAKALGERIQKVLDDLQADVDRTEEKARKLGEEYQAADQEVQEQALKAGALQSQADTASADATAAKQQAAQILIQQYRSSGSDVSLDVFLNSDPDDLLYSMGMSAKVVGQSQGIFDEAVQLQNTAQSLSDQAAVAQSELEELRAVAEAKFELAETAADEARAAYDTQQAKKAEQEQLLAELKKTVASTKEEYEKGVEERAKKAAEAAKNGGVGVYTGPTRIVGGEWAYPSGGRVTSRFGYRINPLGSGRVFHLGIDLGAPCGSWIYAAHEGTVSYSGWNGVYGNFIRIDHGGGVQTEYGHILNGGLLVRNGEKVNVGDHIANVGSTGGSTGCHLHFGIRVDGLVTDPAVYMAKNGVILGQ